MVVDHWQFNFKKTAQNLVLTKSFLEHISLLSTNHGFFFSVFNLGGKIFLSMIFIIFWFSSHIFSSSFGGFLLIDPLSGFPPQFPTGLGGFSSATWPFETYQLPYGTRIFSVVFRFSSPVFLIGLGSFASGSHSSFQWLSCSAEFALEKKGNCNNITFGAESSQSRSHVTTTII